MVPGHVDRRAAGGRRQIRLRLERNPNRLRPLICFVGETTRTTITTNYKVMYSTMLKQEGFVPVYEHSELLSILEAAGSGYRHLMLVRNPYRRLFSFYADKFVTYPPGPDSPVQNSHRLFFDKLGLDADMDPSTMTEAFIATSFPGFVELLDAQTIYSNLHLIPQVETLAGPKRLTTKTRLRRLWRIDRYLKMESDLAELAQLGVDLSIRENPTSIGPVENYYDASALERVGALYQVDFEAFEYPTGEFGEIPA